MMPSWTEREILRESARWVHVPRDGVRAEDERRLLVHLPEHWGTSRVWRSWIADEKQADDLIEQTIGEVCASSRSKIVWHTGDLVSPPFMDERLAARGFEVSEELTVLAFELGDGDDPALPALEAPDGVFAKPVYDTEALREASRVESEVFSAPAISESEIADHMERLENLRRRARGEPAEGSCALRFVASIGKGPSERTVVASAGAEVTGETVRLFGAGTLERFRGRGAYRALVLERCRFAHALGATLALTKANAATSVPILERGGFRAVGAERRHILDIG